MTFVGILVLAAGLSMDAMAAAATRGAVHKKASFASALQIGLLFGGAQALMPLIGWLIGSRIGPLIEAFDHWVVFVILSVIGGKMLWEARGAHDAKPQAEPQANQWKLLFLLAVATSIDALAVGVALPLMGAPVLLPVVTIGITTAILSALGYFIGCRFGAKLGKTFDVIGGLVLIAIGVKTLIEHLTAH